MLSVESHEKSRLITVTKIEVLATPPQVSDFKNYQISP